MLTDPHQMLAAAVTYRNPEDRLSALLGATLAQEPEARALLAKRCGAKGPVDVVGLQLVRGVEGARPDLWLGTRTRRTLAIEAKVEHALSEPQLSALQRAEGAGSIERFAIVAPMRNLSRSASRDVIGTIRDRVVTWGEVGQLVVSGRSFCAQALHRALCWEELMDFGGISDEELGASPHVGKVLHDARLLGEAAVHALTKAMPRFSVTAENHGSLSFSKYRPSDMHFGWQVSKPRKAHIYIGFGRTYKFYGSIWVPRGADADSPVGWTLEDGYIARTWDLASSLQGLAAPDQVSWLVGKWKDALDDAWGAGTGLQA